MDKTKLARSYVEKYIDLALEKKTSYSKRFIAAVMVAENPNVFKDIEAARSYVRRVTNASGEARRSEKNVDITRRFATIEQEHHELTVEPFIIPKQYNNTLWIADLHSRFYSQKALETAINYGIKNNCNSVIINGDFMDHYQFSKFDKSPITLEKFYSEKEWGIDILELLQDCFGKVFLKEGNHDNRREMVMHHMSARCPEIMGLVEYSDYLFFEGSTVEFIKDYNHIIYGDLNAIHGHEYQGGGGIHAAYNRLGKTMDNTISAHSHVSQSVIKSDINGNVYGSWSLGSMCDLHPRYCPKNNWNHGFARTTMDKDGSFEVENKIIHKNKIYNV